MVGRRSHSNESGRSAAAPFFFSVRKTENMNCSCARVPNAEAQYPRNFPNAFLAPPDGRPLCPIPRGTSCTTLLLSSSISLNFLNASRPHVRQFINTEYRKGILLVRRNARSLTMLWRDCSRYSKLCGSLHQREQHSQSIVKLLAFLRTKSMPFLYSVLMNCLTCGLDAFRKFSEIELDKSSVVQLVPRGLGHSGLPSGGARKRWGNSGDTAPRR